MLKKINDAIEGFVGKAFTEYFAITAIVLIILALILGVFLAADLQRLIDAILKEFSGK